MVLVFQFQAMICQQWKTKIDENHILIMQLHSDFREGLFLSILIENLRVEFQAHHSVFMLNCLVFAQLSTLIVLAVNQKKTNYPLC